MFGISFSEIILILVICLIVFGPKQLPQIASKVGLLVLNLQRFWAKLRDEFYQHTGFNEVLQAQQDVLHTYQQIKDSINTDNNIPHNQESYDWTTPMLYQAELDFDHQPELFDEV